MCSTLQPYWRVCEASQRHSIRTPPQHAGKLYTMQPSVLSSWRRVRGHACRQAIGVLLFALYTSCLWRIWPDSAHWPNKHNFFRRQWVEGMLWCDSTDCGACPSKQACGVWACIILRAYVATCPARPLPAKVDILCCLGVALAYSRYYAGMLNAVTVGLSVRGTFELAGRMGLAQCSLCVVAALQGRHCCCEPQCRMPGKYWEEVF